MPRSETTLPPYAGHLRRETKGEGKNVHKSGGFWNQLPRIAARKRNNPTAWHNASYSTRNSPKKKAPVSARPWLGPFCRAAERMKSVDDTATYREITAPVAGRPSLRTIIEVAVSENSLPT